MKAKECQICGCPMRVEYWKVKMNEDGKVLDICPGCKEVYKDQLTVVVSNNVKI